jgi:tetratricopeptide (TPR) repeat protein
MKSRLLARLEERIAVSRDGEKEELLAERAAYLARSGRVEVALSEIAAVRQRSLKPSNSRVSAILNLAEGLCHYYKDMNPTAEDRFARSRAIAQLGGHADLIARASSWLGLVKYGDYKFIDMVRCIDESVEVTDELEPSAAARSSLNIAQTLHLANRFDMSLSWYRRAHLMAVETEDEATISAMLHNMASIWASNTRNASLGGPETPDSSRQAFMGALSTFNFDELVGISALGIFTPLLEAQISSLNLDYERALLLYESNLSELKLKVGGGWQAWLLADRIWCRLKCGVGEDAVNNLDSVFALLDDCQHPDDQAAAQMRMAQSWRVLGDKGKAAQLEHGAQDCWTRFGHMQAEMLRIVTSSSGYKRLEERFPL